MNYYDDKNERSGCTLWGLLLILGSSLIVIALVSFLQKMKLGAQ